MSVKTLTIGSQASLAFWSSDLISIGAGTAFTLLLPRAVATVEVVGARPNEGISGTPVLIVDNEPAMRHALQLHLRRSGCLADAVGEPVAALALLATRSYGAIFLDLQLDALGGESLFAELVERDPDHAARVIFATGDLDSPPARNFLHGAGRPFVGKPFALATVAALLTQAASR